MQILAILQIVLVVCCIGGYFGDDSCFDEGKWRQMQYLVLEAFPEAWFVVKGRDQRCMAINVSPLYTSDQAKSTCAHWMEGGELMKNESWDAFEKAWNKYNAELATLPTDQGENYVHVGFASSAGNSCYMIQLSNNAIRTTECTNVVGFICEYPRQNFCKWETMTDATATNYGATNDDWSKSADLKIRVIIGQQVDGWDKPCVPNLGIMDIDYALAVCSKPLFKDDWSQWSSCGLCGTNDTKYTQSRYQEVVDSCKHLAPQGFQRINTRHPCQGCTPQTEKTETTENTTETTEKPAERLPIGLIVIGVLCAVLLVLAVVVGVVGYRMWKRRKSVKSRNSAQTPVQESPAEKTASKGSAVDDMTSQSPTKKSAAVDSKV